jgi:hypothetical protein
MDITSHYVAFTRRVNSLNDHVGEKSSKVKITLCHVSAGVENYRVF